MFISANSKQAGQFELVIRLETKQQIFISLINVGKTRI